MNGRRFYGILALLFSVAIAANCETPADEAAARRATADRHYAQARGIYQRLVVEHPQDAGHRVWVGRLSGYLGDYATGLAAYDQALTLQPKNLEAMVGKAYILLWTHRYDEGAALISRALEIDPHSIDAHLANARRYVYLRKPDLAMKSLNNVLAIDPTNQEADDILASIRPPGYLKVELGWTSDIPSYASVGGAGTVSAGWISAKNSMDVRLDEWRRFDRSASRGTVALSHTFAYRWAASGSSSFGSRGDIVARWDNSLGLKRSLPSGWAVGAQFRDLVFDGAHIRLAGPQVEYYFERPIWVDVSYWRGWSSDLIGGSQTNLSAAANSEVFRYHERIHRWTVHAGFGRGTEFFAIPAINQLGLLRSDTYIGAVDTPPFQKWSTHLEYIHARRSNGTSEQIVVASLIFKGRHER